jgi:hypothetical protein
MRRIYPTGSLPNSLQALRTIFLPPVSYAFLSLLIQPNLHRLGGEELATVRGLPFTARYPSALEPKSRAEAPVS